MELKKTYVYIDETFFGAYDFMYTDIENMNRIFDSYIDSEGAYFIDNIKVFKDERFVPDVSERIPVRVSNTSGYDAKNQLIRRGFALEKGHIYDVDSLVLVNENNEFVPSAVSQMESYDDGSIKWALLSFVCSLNVGEEKDFYIVNSAIQKKYGVISFADGLIENENFSLSLNKDGICGISLDNEQVLDSIYLYYNDTKLPFSGYDILQENELYVKIRLNAPSNGTMRGEMYVTLWQGSSDIDIEYRFTALKDINIIDMGCAIQCANNAIISGEDNTVNISKDKGQINIVSYDVERFAGAVSENTGFVTDEANIYFEPIINDTEFLWYDGVTRTNHFSITANDAEPTLALQKTPLSVVISPEQFVKSGIIQSTSKNAISDRILESMEYAYDKRNGCFEAGYIPWIIDKARKKVEISTVQHGETDYNLALLHLAQGNSMLYNMIKESSETRSDVSMYKGSLAEVYGAIRYRTGSNMEKGSNNFKTSHPYYGEASGLYMAYLLSGNEYIKESFLNAVEHIYNNIEQGTSELGKYPSMVSWVGGVAKKANYGESRFIIQIRPLMLANQLTGENKYKNAVYNIVDWTKNAQTEDGYWYQAYYNDKTPFVQSGQTQPAVKNYIMLYGARGLSYLLENEENEIALDTLKRFSDFLCEELDNYGTGLWSPTGDADLYEENEDGTRGKMAMQDIMAAEILWRTYEKTADEKYLDAFLECLNAWICALGPGGLPASVSYLHGYYDGSVSSAQASQNLTIFSIIGELEKFFEDNKELIYKKGFGELCEVFSKNSKVEVPSNPSGHSYPELTSSMYNSNAMFVMNVNGKTSGNYYKEYITSNLGKSLWSGMKNIVDAKGNVALNICMNQFDTASAIKCPVYLKNNTVDTEVYIDEYNSEQVRITLKTNEKISLEISDGVFDTKRGYYTYSVEKTDDGFIVTVIDAIDGIPKQGTITIDVDEWNVVIDKIGLFDKNKQKTDNISEAVYISDIELKYNKEIGDVDLFVAQYDNDGRMVSVCKKADMAKLDGSICKIMVWKNMQVMAQSVILER